MISANYSASATSAVRALQSTARDLDTTQTRIATGKKINSSADNASLFALANKVTSQVAESSTYQDNLKTAKAHANVATTAIDTISTTLTDLRAKVVSYGATTDTDAKAAIFADITSLQSQLKTTVKQATLDGSTNFLDGTKTEYSIKSSASSTDVIDLANTNFYDGSAGGILDQTGTASSKSITGFVAADIADSTKVTNMLTDSDTAITATNTAASTIGSAVKRITAASDFLTTLNDIKTKAISSLVDADLNEESAKLTALQTSQSLQATVLQIANASSQNTLRLFQ